jgi:hypothetical protein
MKFATVLLMVLAGTLAACSSRFVKVERTDDEYVYAGANTDSVYPVSITTIDPNRQLLPCNVSYEAPPTCANAPSNTWVHLGVSPIESISLSYRGRISRERAPEEFQFLGRARLRIEAPHYATWEGLVDVNRFAGGGVTIMLEPD